MGKPHKACCFVGSYVSNDIQFVNHKLKAYDVVILQVYLWYPLSIISGGTTAKIMVAAKDNFLGKYIYKDTIARNIAAVIYRVMLSLGISHVLHFLNHLLYE